MGIHVYIYIYICIKICFRIDEYLSDVKLLIDHEKTKVINKLNSRKYLRVGVIKCKKKKG